MYIIDKVRRYYHFSDIDISRWNYNREKSDISVMYAGTQFQIQF